MDLVSKMTGVYVNFYNTHLADLAVRLEQIMTVTDVDPANLEETVVNVYKDVSRRIVSETPTNN